LSKTKRGNIQPLDGPDPFPKTGLTKQYEPFIRSYVGEFCRDHEGAIYEHVLVDAVRIAVEFEPKFKPELGHDFSTPLRTWFKRLHRLWEADQHQIKIPETEGDEEEAEEADEAVPIVYRGGNGTRIAIDRQWAANGSYNCRQRVVIGAQLNSTDEGEAREAIGRVSVALDTLLDNRPLTEIRASIHGILGEHVDVQFPRARKPPNFHKWPAAVLQVSFDQVVGKDELEGNLHLKDVIAGSDPRGIPNADSDVNKLRRAIEAELPFLTPNERKVLEWKLDGRGGRLCHWAARNGISKGHASKLNQRVTERLGARMKRP
jgi:hypothetical protein